MTGAQIFSSLGDLRQSGHRLEGLAVSLIVTAEHLIELQAENLNTDNQSCLLYTSTERYLPDNELKKLCLGKDLHMSQAQLKHLGTDSNFETMRQLILSLEGRCDILTRTAVTDVEKDSHILHLESKGEASAIQADRVIFAVGRAGSRFFSKWCQQNHISLSNNQVDIGVRVELPSIVWEDFSKKIYEPKIWYRSKVYGDTTPVSYTHLQGRRNRGAWSRQR